MSKNQLETKIAELEKLVKFFESEDTNIDLAAGVKKYEQAMKLVAEIRKELEKLELQINEINIKYNQED